jgi:molybdenum cofactor cytidylyltransferase
MAAPGSDATKGGAKVSAIVLAAGEARRMGALKLALRLGEKSLLKRVVEAALAAPVDEVVVVLGHGAANLQSELPQDGRVRPVYNPDFAQGQSSSLKVGIGVLGPQVEAAVFLLGDQPLVSPEAIEGLIATFQTHHPPIVQPLYRGVPGNPVLFARALFAALLQVTGDRGGRDLLASHRSEVAMVDLDLEAPADVDTMEDYQKLVKAH